MGGVVVRAGEAVMPEHNVANRDESVFADGWEIDFHRLNPESHLSFAFGSHHCMGANLARLEIRLTFETLVQRFPDLRLAVPADEIRWSPTSMLRTIEALPLAW
jgi:cytochrome P450